jgi:tRNA nucleotidyltransferase (CCA-adding enzyme)
MDAHDADKPPARDVDVVITHSSADFDSFAAAVGLAKLRGPDTIVVVPAGEAPALRRFLMLHRQLYRICDARNVDTARLRWVGIVDTVRRDRLGVAAGWPALAEHVEVYDHHIGRECDITNPNRIDVVVDAVGAVATLICERLVAAGHQLNPAEATLLALAIHSDTGSLTFEQTTSRDADMLAWLIRQGAIQRSIAEFSHSLLTNEQQLLLSQGLSVLKRTRVRGVEIGSVLLVGPSFLKGMSTVANDLLDLSNVDVLVLTYVNCRGRRASNKKRRKPAIDVDAESNDVLCGPEELKQVSIICRARARTEGVDFRDLLADLNGGGHARAASASLKMTEADAEDLTDLLVKQIVGQIPLPVPVSDFMTTEVVSVAADASLLDARSTMALHGHSGLPVVDENDALVGMIDAEDINLAESKGGSDTLRRPVSGFMHQKAFSVSPETPLYVAEQIIIENSIGRLPVVSGDAKLKGIVSRTDVLVQRRMWYPHVVTTELPVADSISPEHNERSLHSIGQIVGGDENGCWD